MTDVSIIAARIGLRGLASHCADYRLGIIYCRISAVLTVFVPELEVKPLILTVTYIVVLFAIIVKDPTVAPMARRLGDNPDPR